MGKILKRQGDISGRKTADGERGEEGPQMEGEENIKRETWGETNKKVALYKQCVTKRNTKKPTGNFNKSYFFHPNFAYRLPWHLQLSNVIWL